MINLTHQRRNKKKIGKSVEGKTEYLHSNYCSAMLLFFIVCLICKIVSMDRCVSTKINVTE